MRKNRVSLNIAFGLVILVVLLIGINYVYQAWDHRAHPVESSAAAARTIAYQSLSKTQKATVLDWQEAQSEGYMATAEHPVRSFKGPTPTDIKGIQTYRVTFKTTNAFMGSITVYVNEDCDSVIGYGFQY